MNLKEKLSYFWNVTLGEDYPQAEDIEKSNNPEFAELKESLNRIQAMENKYSKPSGSNKVGKGNSEKNKIVETVVVNPKAVTKAVEANKENTSKEIEER